MAPMSALFRIVHDSHPPVPDNISRQLNDFLLLCFKKDTAQRPNALRLKTHPWLTQPHDSAADAPPDAMAAAPAMPVEVWDPPTLSGADGYTSHPLPEHIKDVINPKEETIRAVEEIVAHNLSMQRSNQTPRGDGRGNTACYSGPSDSSAGGEAARASTITSLAQATAGARGDQRGTGGATAPGGHRRVHSTGSSSSSSSLGLAPGTGTGSSIYTDHPSRGMSGGAAPFLYRPSSTDRMPHASAASAAFGAPHLARRPKNLIGDAYLEEMVAAAAAAQQRLHHGRTSLDGHPHGGEVLNILIQFAERPDESLSTNYSDLLRRDAPVPRFAALLAQRLKTPWPSPSDSALEDASSSLDYSDPFSDLPPVSLKPTHTDEAATRQRELLRGHIQQLQKASQQKHEGVAIDACGKLLEIFSPDGPDGSMHPIAEGKEGSRANSISVSSERAGSRSGESRANEAAVFMSEHGMLPLVHMRSSS